MLVDSIPDQVSFAKECCNNEYFRKRPNTLIRCLLIAFPPKRWFKAGLGIVWTNMDSQWNPVYKVFIQFIFVERTNWLVVALNSNVILTQKMCSQHSSRVAASKHQALAFHLPMRIWHMFLVSGCRGEWHVGLYTIPVPTVHLSGAILLAISLLVLTICLQWCSN